MRKPRNPEKSKCQPTAKKAKAHTGRPSDYSAKTAKAICARLMEGESLRSICGGEGIPSKSTVMRWLAVHAEFRDQYARAREIQTELMADEILDIADDGRNDWEMRQYGDSQVEVVNQEAVQRSKLRVDARKWLLAKLQPKKFGDSVDLKHSGSLEVKNIEDLTDDQLDALAARLGTTGALAHRKDDGAS